MFTHFAFRKIPLQEKRQNSTLFIYSGFEYYAGKDTGKRKRRPIDA